MPNIFPAATEVIMMELFSRAVSGYRVEIVQRTELQSMDWANAFAHHNRKSPANGGKKAKRTLLSPVIARPIEIINQGGRRSLRMPFSKRPDA